ncbi:pyrimidine-nucleoside phosphorylase [Jeotgalibaca porci]|uniref:Pyrimidine-nucleoside phosphorylase n=2 Tax=Jeotgalibaca porci TaxID=1868793 RepID=A0A6G7WJ89_9LACT|nr:pyrimidine-nucleoside phosphorylase [Jeotgalibaca porci]NLB98097.1 pyrimidine-nucleoside phosphorylase [Lactobacillales bacterium]QIK52344.1 pyrimidine-nucleoside phosphorylase [Jeotgalibaca porci]
MRMVDLIVKKQQGKELTKEEINFIISGFTNGTIPDYQMSAFAMAVYFQDMTDNERMEMTMAMAESGDQIDLSAIEGIKVDKHSTGGVGDTTTLVLAPLVASAGVPVAKMSGRGLGHTGGTIDKLESVPGFHVEISEEKFMELVNKNKVAVVGQSGDLTPADKKIYALRDVTGTVNSLPLIASSIMSKKIASGADAIVLDVKVGAGAFMKTPEDAEKLARAMVSIGNLAGRKTMAIISDMSQPLGRAVGNTLEVEEAIETLKGNGPKDLEELCLVLGAQMVYLGGGAESLEDAKALLKEKLTNGEALEQFKIFLEAQDGNPNVVEDYSLMPQASITKDVKATESGYITEITADDIGVAAMKLGAGRETQESVIDLAAGLMLHKKVDDYVEKGDVIVTLYANFEDTAEAEKMIQQAYHYGKEKVEPVLIHKVITE